MTSVGVIAVYGIIIFLLGIWLSHTIHVTIMNEFMQALTIKVRTKKSDEVGEENDHRA